MSAVNPVLVVALPVLYVLAATFSMMQVSVILALLGQAAVKVRTIKALSFAEPAVTALVDYFTRVYGPLHKFTPQPTHILLMAVVVALVVNGQRRK
ncbi:hypothetical protein HYH03_018064 [Edaphochlamys debaryana]|uniref:Uncharacterized protein n=1 Tax=Edaphochlamys debaryana TaxID=47281 RepID=A0A835XMU3_9CHLO|nr:hypothetical protein HYH03_018064 [Edaphochlamys debaryana]|eukprot:KAG2483034.1 hypothetical protein HYH03_018064 [Edaphochlamys debaryana]